MSQWQDKLIAELRRDWRRTAVLVGLTIAALVLVIRQFVGGDPVSAQAKGNGPPVAALAAGGSPAAASPAVAAGAPSAGSAALEAVWKDLRQARSLDRHDPLPPINRDPFVIDFSQFPPAPGAGAAKPAGQPSDAGVAEQKRQTQLEMVRADAAKLKLQSVLLGDEPRVLINGEIYRVGDSVRPGANSQPFTLVRVNSTSAALERDSFEVTLRLQ